MKKINVLFSLSAVFFLASCISGSDLTLIDVKSGTIATGSASRLTHTVTITLNGKEYAGSFDYVQRPHPGVGLLEADSFIRDGKMIAKADDGSSLTCEATFQGWSNSGNGLCHDDAKNTYDLMITTIY